MIPSDLPAGRELDALIAEKVMGLPPEQWRHDAPGCEDIYYNVCNRCGLSQNSKSDAEFYQERCPEPAPYSTDIAAAWLVVEKLRLAVVSGDDPKDGSHGYWAGVPVPLGGNMEDWRGADTAPLAICRAALAAAQTFLTISQDNANRPA